MRTVWDESQEKWFFSIVDVIGILTDSVDPTAYWRKLKQRLKEGGNETVTNCHGLKIRAVDGKMRMTDKTWSDHTAKEYKKLKGLKKENLRDNITNRELVMNMLAELSTKDISEATNPQTMDEHTIVAQQGGEVARNARLELEHKTGQKVITSLNAKSIHQIDKHKEKE